MLYTVAVVALMTFGQCASGACGDPYYSAPVCAPVDYIEYRGIVAQTKFYDKIYYGDKLWQVPIINGYAPEVNVSRLSNGGTYTVYDYSRRISYELCRQHSLQVMQGKTTQAPKKELTPPQASAPLDPVAPKKELSPSPAAAPKQVPMPVPAPKKDLLPGPVDDPAPTTAATPKKDWLPGPVDDPMPTKEQAKQPEKVKKDLPEVKPEEMISLLPPEPKKAAQPAVEQKPKAPMKELFAPRGNDEVKEVIQEPIRVIKPSYEAR